MQLSEDDLRQITLYAASLAAAAAYLHPRATPHQVKHLLGSAIHQARALELAAESDEGVGHEGLRLAMDHASPTVRDDLRRMPTPHSGRGRLGELLHELDAEVRR